MKMYRVLTLCSVCLLAQGCQKSEPEPSPSEAATPSAVAMPEAPQPSDPPAPTSDVLEPKTKVTEGIPTEEDFEEEAGEVITAENLEAQLDKLEAEIEPN